MKKLLSCLLIFMITLMGVSCGNVTKSSDKIIMESEMPMAAPAPMSEEVIPIKTSEDVMLELMSQPVEVIYYSDVKPGKQIGEVTEENLRLISDDIPLSYDNQVSLQEACEEFNVPYALALSLIETETNFRNVIGDNGDSTGYMQIQQRWHYDRMERLGVYDLTDPKSNFRVGLDYLSECYDIYGSWGLAVTVYNMGHNPGYITDYAYNVMSGYEKWLGVVGVI